MERIVTIPAADFWSAGIDLETPDVAVQMKRSLTAQAVAELFAKLEQAVVGIPAEDRKTLFDVPEIARRRCIDAAEIGVKRLDPDHVVRCADMAVKDHLEDHFAGLLPSQAEIDAETARARQIIGLFLKIEREEL